jgi:thiol:disulfide interchange protein DsbD
MLHAQSPVQWEYSAKKVADKTYEVRLTATINSPWHIYSQTTPDGGPTKTSISFLKNPLVTIGGNVKENGAMVSKHEDVFGVDVRYYENKVVFVQKVTLKGNAKTNITGTVEYMACNDEQCMPARKEKFNIKLE